MRPPAKIRSRRLLNALPELMFRPVARHAATDGRPVRIKNWSGFGVIQILRRLLHYNVSYALG
jgi:hypothetical protein